MTENKPTPPKSPNPNDPKGNKPGLPTPKQGRGMFGFFAVMLMVLMLVMFLSSAEQGKEITFQQFKLYYTGGQIDKDSVTIRESGITAILRQPEVDGDKSSSVRVPITPISREEISRRVYELTNGNIKEKPPAGWVNFLYVFGPFILLIGILWFLLARGMKAAGGGGGMMARSASRATAP